MSERSPVRRRALLLASLLAALAGAAPALAAAPTPPPSTLLPGIPVVPYDAGIVLPTDTIVTPPAAGFEPDEHVALYALGAQMDGPNIAWGRIQYGITAAGPAIGVRVTLVNRQTGWRYATTTVAAGRYRVAVPNGTYAMLLEDPAHPGGQWIPPELPAPYVNGEYQLWGGGLGHGFTTGIVPRLRESCLWTVRTPALVIDGLEPGNAPPTAPCPYDKPGSASPEAFLAAGDSMTDDIFFARTGRAPDKPSTVFTDTAGRTPTPPPVAAAPATPRATVSSRTLRPDARSRFRVSVRCAGAARCRTRIVVRASSRTVASTRRVIGARRAATVTLRPGQVGRARLRRASRVRVEVTTGGETTAAILRVRR